MNLFMVLTYVFFILFFSIGILAFPTKKRICAILSTIVTTLALPMSILVILGYYCSKVGIPLSRENLLFIYSIIFLVLPFKKLKTDKDVVPHLIILFLVSILFVLIFSHVHTFPTGYGVDAARHLALSEYVYTHQGYPQADWTFIHSQYFLYPAGTATVTGVFSTFLGVDPAYSLYPLMLFITGLTILNVFWILHQLKPPVHGYFLCGIFLTFSKLFYSVSISGFYAQIFGLFLLTSFIVFLMQEKHVSVLIVVETALTLSYPLYAFLPLSGYLICKDPKKIALFFAGNLLLCTPFAVEHLQNPVWLVPTPSISFFSFWKEALLLILVLALAGYGLNPLYQKEKGYILIFFAALWIGQIPVFFVLDFFGYVELYFLYKQVFILLVLLPVFLTFSVLRILQTVKSLHNHGITKRVVTSLSIMIIGALFCVASLNLGREISTLTKIPPPLTKEEYFIALELQSLENVACTNQTLDGFSSKRHVRILMLSAISQTYFDVLSFDEFLSAAETVKYHYLIVEKEDYQKYGNSFSQYCIRKEGNTIYLLETF